jgi:hypothetical protein
MIFLSLIMNLLLSLGIGTGGGIGGTTDALVEGQHHYGPDNPGHGHTIHGHSTVLHHGVHGHTTGPSGHAPQNPHNL